MVPTSKVAERTEIALRLRPPPPFVVLYGPGTTDLFVGQDYLVRSAEQEINERLKSAGFQRVVFSSRDNPLYFLEGDPRSPRPASEEQSATPRVRRAFFAEHLEGPKELPVEEPAKIEDLPQSGVTTVPSVALRQIDGWMRQTAKRTALVIRSGVDWVQYLNVSDIRASYMRRWIFPERYKYRNLCVLMLGDLDEPTIDRLGGRVPALGEFFRRHEQRNRAVLDHPIKYLGCPTSEELHRLLQVIRLSRTPKIAWREQRTPLGRNLLAEAMFADPASRTLVSWEGHLSDMEELSSKAMAKRGMLKDASVDGRSALERLNEDIVGLGNVKSLVAEIQQAALREAKARQDGTELPAPMRHMVFAGNPGTGKTEVARLIGEIYREAGVLKRGHTHEVRAPDLVSEYVGQSARLTDAAVDAAMDGILFIDEAHQLTAEGRNQHAGDAIGALVPRLENDRERFVAIAAGYPGPDFMGRFRTSDPGMPSRFPRVILFEDYDAEELHKIFLIHSRKRRLELSKDAESLFQEVISGMQVSNSREFQNARSMRQLAEDLERKAALRGAFGPGGAMTIEPGDLPDEYRQYLRESASTIEEVLAKLDTFVGLQRVKDEILKLYKESVVNRRTPDEESAVAPHIVFTGNPGTGKTSIAKLMGQVYRALGLLPTADVHVVSREDIIRGFVGQSEGRARNVVEQAMGGILFVDEAHQLGRGGEGDFGAQILGVINRAMTERAGEFAVIFAGYEDKMDAVYDIEGGLTRRFTYTFRFDDYTTEQLVEILSNMAAPKRTLSAGARSQAAEIFDTIRRTNPTNFGNAGAAEKMLKHIKTKQAARLYDDPGNPDFATILPEDLPNAGELI